jgi:hypothetical protein
MWQREFESSADAVGQRIRVNNEEMQINAAADRDRDDCGVSSAVGRTSCSDARGWMNSGTVTTADLCL